MSSEKDQIESSVASDGSPEMVGDYATVFVPHRLQPVVRGSNRGRGRMNLRCNFCGSEFSGTGKEIHEQLMRQPHRCVEVHFSAVIPAERQAEILARI